MALMAGLEDVGSGELRHQLATGKIVGFGAPPETACSRPRVGIRWTGLAFIVSESTTNRTKVFASWVAARDEALTILDNDG